VLYFTGVASSIGHCLGEAHSHWYNPIGRKQSANAFVDGLFLCFAVCGKARTPSSTLQVFRGSACTATGI
jgi:hypothetical protein